MTSDDQALVARSIAALDDQTSIETRSIEAINADLTTLNIDPKTSIMAARKLAKEQNSPAQRLLARLDDADAIASEIDRIEAADLADVQADVQISVPAGVAASAAANAKRKSGLPSNVTGFKRPSRHFWGWGGSMVGIAACLLLFIMTRPDRLYQIERPMSEETESAGVFSGAMMADDAEFDRVVEAPSEQRGALETKVADSLAMPARTAMRKERAGTPTPKVELAHRDLDAPTRRKGAAPGLLMTRLAPPAADLADSGSATSARNLEVSPNALAKAEPDAAQIVASAAERDRHHAILIVEPNIAPADLIEKARTLPKGDLIDRLDEARALLGTRPVVALVTILRDGKKVDAAITMRESSDLTETLGTVADGALPTRNADDGFEFIELPKKP